MVQLPNIKGTADDGPINGLIDACNKQNNLVFTAHTAAAIVRFLIENHETEAGPKWISKVLPQVEDVRIREELVDKIHARLTEASELRHSGYSPALIASLLLAILIGIIWWFFS